MPFIPIFQTLLFQFSDTRTILLAPISVRFGWIFPTDSFSVLFPEVIGYGSNFEKTVYFTPLLENGLFLSNSGKRLLSQAKFLTHLIRAIDSNTVRFGPSADGTELPLHRKQSWHQFRRMDCFFNFLQKVCSHWIPLIDGVSWSFRITWGHKTSFAVTCVIFLLGELHDGRSWNESKTSLISPSNPLPRNFRSKKSLPDIDDHVISCHVTATFRKLQPNRGSNVPKRLIYTASTATLRWLPV